MLQEIDLSYRNGVLTTSKSLQSGVVYINATPAASAASSFPVGFAASTTQTGLALLSSYPSDDVNGGTDGTSRISLYSYQRANANSFGEVVRIFNMKKDAKSMTAWYAPVSGYDGTTRDPSGSSWTPVTWIGSHWESNGHTGNHKHWEIEVPDVNRALQGRFEVLFGPQGDESIGLDKTNILTNLTDFTIRCYGQSTTTNADQKQRLILNAVAGHDREINWSVTTDSTGQRWAMMADATAEAGSNVGTNFVLTRYDDSGTSLGTPLWIQRSDGQTTFGAAAAKGAKVASVWGTSGQHGFSAQPTSSPGTGASFHTVLSGATDRAMATVIGAQPATIFVQYADGKHEWGDGTNPRDANLYRASAGVIQTDQSLVVTSTLTIAGNPSTGDSNNPKASDNGLKAWSFDAANASSAVAIVAGTLYLTAIYVHKPVTVTKIWWGMGAAANTPTAGQNFAGIFSSAGTLLASAGIDTQVTGSNGPQNVTISSTALAVGWYWVSFLQNATTPQQFVRSAPAFLAIANAGLTTATLRACVNGTGQTAMPASITPSSNSQSGAAEIWAAVS